MSWFSSWTGKKSDLCWTGAVDTTSVVLLELLWCLMWDRPSSNTFSVFSCFSLHIELLWSLSWLVHLTLFVHEGWDLPSSNPTSLAFSEYMLATRHADGSLGVISLEVLHLKFIAKKTRRKIRLVLGWEIHVSSDLMSTGEFSDLLLVCSKKYLTTDLWTGQQGEI